MGLADIAAGIETTTPQRERGVATVDATDQPICDVLSRFAADLPCEPDAAVAVLEAYSGGGSVGTAARAAGVSPMTAAKTLHLLGVEGVTPLAPTARTVLSDWLRAELSRSEALALTGASEAEFALAAFVETHDPIDGAREAVERTFSPSRDAMVEKRDRLAETMSDASEFL